MASHGGHWFFYHDVVVMSCAIETNFGDGQCFSMEDGVALHRKKLCTHRKILCTWKVCKLKYIEVMPSIKLRWGVGLGQRLKFQLFGLAKWL